MKQPYTKLYIENQKLRILHCARSTCSNPEKEQKMQNYINCERRKETNSSRGSQIKLCIRVLFEILKVVRNILRVQEDLLKH